MDDAQLEREIRGYAADELAKVEATDWGVLAKIVAALLDAKRRGVRIFTAGNGGSLSTASHMANDFTKGCRVHDRPGFDITCLGDANAVLTCLANDFSYEDVYSLQLETQGHPGDVLVYFSGSGKSPNLVKAAETARRLQITTIGFLGRDGGTLKSLSDLCLIAPTDSMEQIEDMHLFYQHNMVCAIRAALEAE